MEMKFDNLARVVRHWADGPVADGQPREWLAIERSLQRQGGVAARRRLVAASAVALTAVAALLGLRGMGRPNERLTFVVSDGRAALDGTVQPSHAPARLVFSDGSVVTVNPGSRGTVVGTTARGARVRLDGGRARFAVAHRPQADWSVDAGPFAVTVHGTVFDVSWAGGSGALSVELLVGSVTIKGPVRGGEVTLRAGQRLTAHAASGRTEIHALAPAAGRGDTPGVAPLAAAGAVEAPPPPDGAEAAQVGGEQDGSDEEALGQRPVATALGDRGASTGRLPARRLSATIREISGTWSARVAAGLFQSVVDDADRTGIERCLAHASAGSLEALADAARYARRTDLARRALLAERRRFAGSVGSHDAAFLIGRLADDTDGDLREALRWYDRYLEEGERGTYASEALGRKMLALDRLGDAEDARAIADRYLDTFPGGAFATRARRIQSRR